MCVMGAMHAVTPAWRHAGECCYKLDVSRMTEFHSLLAQSFEAQLSSLSFIGSCRMHQNHPHDSGTPGGSASHWEKALAEQCDSVWLGI